MESEFDVRNNKVEISGKRYTFKAGLDEAKQFRDELDRIIEEMEEEK